MVISTFLSRGIAKRIHIRGDLVLTEPAHFGGGNIELGPDMILALDPLEKKPILWGTSLTGALRTYLFNYLHGFIEEENAYKELAEDKEDIVNQLFGFQVGDEGDQSWLVVSDAIADERVFEFRDMVNIDPATSSAMDEQKFDAELIAVGTRFPIRMELLLPRETSRANEFIHALAIALRGLQLGEIKLGAKKKSGWGACTVTTWSLREYDCDTAKGLLGWLADEEEWTEGKDIFQLLKVKQDEILPDKRTVCILNAKMHLDSPLLIGSKSTDAKGADVVPFSRHNLSNENQKEWVISGTALAGVLRNQSFRILRTLGYSIEKTQDFQNDLWGFVKINPNDTEEKAHASNVMVDESQLDNVFPRVRSRIRINPFTSGVCRGALFNEVILLPRGSDTNFSINIIISNPKEEEIGLLLLALKDLCTGFISAGAGWGIGRGFMSCSRLDVEIFDQDKKISYEIETAKGKMTSPRQLTTCVQKLTQGASHEN